MESVLNVVPSDRYPVVLQSLFVEDAIIPQDIVLAGDNARLGEPANNSLFCHQRREGGLQGLLDHLIDIFQEGSGPMGLEASDLKFAGDDLWVDPFPKPLLDVAGDVAALHDALQDRQVLVQVLQGSADHMLPVQDGDSPVLLVGRQVEVYGLEARVDQNLSQWWREVRSAHERLANRGGKVPPDTVAADDHASGIHSKAFRVLHKMCAGAKTFLKLGGVFLLRC